MKKLNILAASLMLVVAQNATAYSVAHTGEPACPNENVFLPNHADNHTNLPLYLNTIADISLNYEGAMLTGTITLANGAILHVKDYAVRDDNEMKTWARGDLLFFNAEIARDNGLVISAKRLSGQDEKVSPYLIYDVTQEAHTGLMIVEINEEGKFVKLNDNTVWEFSWMNRFSTKKWTVGQHVIVQGFLHDKNSYEFINLSIPTTFDATNAKASFVM